MTKTGYHDVITQVEKSLNANARPSLKQRKQTNDNESSHPVPRFQPIITEFQVS